MPQTGMNAVKPIEKCVWEIPATGAMRVPIRLYANERILPSFDEQTIGQARNVASLPGIVGKMQLFADAHVGYGMPVGGTAAFDEKEGIISPGIAGFDIACGMRALVTNLTLREAKPKIRALMDCLFKKVPVGVGRKGTIALQKKDFEEVMVKGAKWCVQNGYGWKEDLKRMEEKGCINGAKPETVSNAAMERGSKQLGTLGSGNHYLEVQLSTANNIFDSKKAKAFGITGKNQIVAMIHSGSRGFGHQVCTDYSTSFLEGMPKYGITVPDRNLSCAPFQSEEGQKYYAAMACAANNAFANRQMITHLVRESFEQVFGKSAETMKMRLVYDVAHNIVKLEKHWVEGKKRKVVVHRKGSTRAFGPGEKDLPEAYQKTGQPVIVGGSMETGSYLCVGTEKAMRESFGSTLHGSGRTMSRQKAKQEFRGEKLQQEMLRRGIVVKAASMEGLAEEAGKAYKNINDVIDSMHTAGISLKVAALHPIGNIKG
jgi:tRNA-splicing ligase RtcB